MRAIAVLLILVLILNPACTSIRSIPPREIKGPKDRIYAVVYHNGTVVAFRPSPSPSPEYGPAGYAVYGYYVWDKRSIEGRIAGGETLSVPVDSLKAVRVERFNTKHVVLLTSLAVVVIIGVALASWAKDPFGGPLFE